MPATKGTIYQIGGLDRTELEFRETSDGGVNWSKPKLTEIFDPPYPETLTPSRCDRKFYLASDAGVTRLGTIFSKEYLVTKMNKLDISQNVGDNDKTYHNQDPSNRNVITANPKSVSRTEIAEKFCKYSLRALSGADSKSKRGAQSKESYAQIYWKDLRHGVQLHVFRTHCKDFEGETPSVLMPHKQGSVKYVTDAQPSGSSVGDQAAPQGGSRDELYLDPSAWFPHSVDSEEQGEGR